MQRSIPFSAVFNFRDLGGYPGVDGRPVRWGRVFRSDTLSRLAEPDRDAFTALGIRTVVDLRRDYEIDRDGRVPQWDGLIWRNINPNHPEWDHGVYRDEDGPARFLADRYRELADAGQSALASALGVIADTDEPVVVHCVAGKDRTGVLCGLTLSLLGVSDVDIATDYALTEESEARFMAWWRSTDPVGASVPQPLFYTRTPPEAMRWFLSELRERHGSVEDYVRAGGLTPTQLTALRTRLLT